MSLVCAAYAVSSSTCPTFSSSGCKAASSVRASNARARTDRADSGQRLDRALEEVAALHGVKDCAPLRKLASIYIDSANEDGFIFNFYDDWPHAVYMLKGNAKRALDGATDRGGNSGELRPGIDVKISTKPLATGRRGGHNRKQILLTRSGLVKFLVCSAFPVSRALACFFTKLGTQHCVALVDDECVLPDRYHASAKRSAREMLDDVEASEDSRSLHDAVRDRLAEIHGGQAEATLPSGSRVDVLCPDVAIEVKQAALWRHAVGQAISYAIESKRRGRVHLLTAPPKEAFVVCRTVGLELTWGDPDDSQGE